MPHSWVPAGVLSATRTENAKCAIWLGVKVPDHVMVDTFTILQVPMSLVQLPGTVDSCGGKLMVAT